LVSTWVRVN